MRRLAAILCFVTTQALARSAHADPFITDLFNRDVSTFGLTLPDWEGYMANPAIQVTLTPPTTAAFPVKISLASPNPMLYFDLPSQATAQGPRKDLLFNNAQPQSAFISVFPARKKRSQESALNITLLDARGHRAILNIPLHITPIETHDASPTFPITVDFSQDKTGFYKSPAHRAIFQQAVNDWAFYLQDTRPNPVQAHAEKTWIFEPTGFTKSNIVANTAPYKGYLLYAYGIDGPELRSGGEPSAAGEFQLDGTRRLPIRRSGGVETEILGNYNKLGWLPPDTAEQQWWNDTNLGNVPNDFYSIMHHEMAHALFFNPTNRKFPRNEVLKDDTVHDYLGADIKTDLHDHFDAFIDPASLHGAFGNEYHGKTPYGRWLITKLDLLCAQAVGYQLRPLAPLLPLSIQTRELPTAPRLRLYKADLIAQGGLPVYDWHLDIGDLPPGLTLNRFTGRITGTPTRPGDYPVTIRVRDYDAAGQGVTRQFQITVMG